MDYHKYKEDERYVKHSGYTSNGYNKGQLCLRILEVLQNSLVVFILHNIVKIECII